MSHFDTIAAHYTQGQLSEQIISGLQELGKDPDRITIEDLAPVDGFHLRGRAATEELATWTDVRTDHKVLDVGSGLGGTCRYLASRTGCHVTGLDLTEEYCRIAEDLSSRVGLADRTAFRQGSALSLPFDKAEFDVVWTEHVQMNITDKRGFYGEIARVLKPGGCFAFHDILAGEDAPGPVHFPVPWAQDASMSHLFPPSALREVLQDAELVEVRWEDKTAASAEFLRTALDRAREQGPASLGLHLLMGHSAPLKFENVLRNITEGRISVVQGTVRRP